MKPPQVAREGTKKTVFTNFMELCKTMNRQPEHAQMFLLAELGTSGSLDGQQRLVVKGRFLPKAFEGVLRRYVNECVPAACELSPGFPVATATATAYARCPCFKVLIPLQDAIHLIASAHQFGLSMGSLLFLPGLT